MTDRSDIVGGLLKAWGRGELGARDELLPLVYRELRLRAAGYLRKARRDHTLQPTALVHEVYLRLAGDAPVAWQDRAHFFPCRGADDATNPRGSRASASGREAPEGSARRWRDWTDDRIGRAEPRSSDLLALDQALSDLTTVDPRMAEITELRYFGGLSEDEVAHVLSISRSTVTREWQTARTWFVYGG